MNETNCAVAEDLIQPASDPGLTTSPMPLRSVLRHLDLSAVSEAARKESRNRELHLPPVSTYRWWARRTESVNGALIDAFLRDYPGRHLVADPFSGGGVIALAAVLRGQRVYAQDLNPWATAGLAAMLSLPDPHRIQEAGDRLGAAVRQVCEAAYGTRMSDGSRAEIAHTIRVATSMCSSCGYGSRIIPHSMVSLIHRKERSGTEAILACPNGHLFRGRWDQSTNCSECGIPTDPYEEYTLRRKICCSACGHEEKLEDRAGNGSWGWEVALVERVAGRRREISIPTAEEIAQADDPDWQPITQLGQIPEGQETRVLLRHGFQHWDDLYPRRQRVVMEALLRAVSDAADDAAIQQVLRILIYGSAEMAGHLSRWDRWYLKSYEAMANHRFNFTTLPVEPNVWGTGAAGRGTVSRRLAQAVKAARWMAEQVSTRLNLQGPIPGSSRGLNLPEDVDVRVVQGTSERIVLSSEVVDLTLTDPPYHDDVQYGELSLPLRAWSQLSTEALQGEAVVNDATGQNAGEGDYRALLTRIFTEVRRTLKPDGRLIFSYANREPAAWADVFTALEAAGFRAIGCAVVHSENETDHAKRGVRACTLDLIMELAPQGAPAVEQWRSNGTPRTDEEKFLRIAGDTFLQVGSLPLGWQDTLHIRLSQTSFLDS